MSIYIDQLLRSWEHGNLSLGILCLAGLLAFFGLWQKSPFPKVNEKGLFEIRDTHTQKRSLTDARKLIKAGLSKASVFQINSDNGVKVVLAPKYAQELRSHPALSFGAAISKEFHGNVTGFEPFKQGTSSDAIFQDAVRMHLTQSLGAVIKPLSEETDFALRNAWTDSRDWHEIVLKSSMLNLVAQLSSKVFLGNKICRNPDWLRITVAYTMDSFVAAQELRLWPRFTRPLVANFLTSCRKIRQELQDAKDIIIPVLEERRMERECALQKGEKPKRYADAMQWMEDCAKGRQYDAAVAQISFSLAAIHTTSDMLSQVILDICDQPEVIKSLREEVITVVQEEGWEKSTLYKLKLMDSVLKESQRLKPNGIGAMRRHAASSFRLHDGTAIGKGTSLFVSNERMWDPEFYPNPEKFDAYRFVKLREEPGQQTAAQSVSPSPEHMGFGFGKHACPGRFFAINELKVALCHILLKYDVALAKDCVPEVRKYGLSLSSDPSARVSIRRRKEEISLL